MDNSRKVSFSDDDDFLHFAGKNHLFVIGIDKYENGIRPLDNCVRDAAKLVQILTEKYNFDKDDKFTLYNEEATSENIIEQFSKYAKQLTENDNLLIYFSGHGYFDGIPYLVPADAKVNKISGLIQNEQIKSYIKNCKAKHILLIVDSCYSGTFLLQEKDFSEDNERFPKEVIKSPSRWVLAAGRVEKVSDGEYGKHSPFAYAIHLFLENNRDKTFITSDLAQYVKKVTAQNAQQVPIAGVLQDSNDWGGEFVFKPRNNEADDFAVCKTKNDCENFRKKYPYSRFLPQIVEKISNFLQQEAKNLYKTIISADWDKKEALIDNYLSLYRDIDKDLYIKVLEEGKKTDDYLIWKNVSAQSTHALRLFIEKNSNNFFIFEAKKALAEKDKEIAAQKEKQRLDQVAELKRLKEDAEQKEAQNRLHEENEQKEKSRLAKTAEAKRLKEENERNEKLLLQKEIVNQSEKANSQSFGQFSGFRQNYKPFVYIGIALFAIFAIWGISQIFPSKSLDNSHSIINEDSLRQVAEQLKQDSIKVGQVVKTDVVKIDNPTKLVTKQTKQDSIKSTKGVRTDGGMVPTDGGRIPLPPGGVKEPIGDPTNKINIDELKKQIYFISAEEIYLENNGRTKTLPGGGWTGTGFMLEDGRFVTARHVIQYWRYTFKPQTFVDMNCIENSGGTVRVKFKAVSSDGSEISFTYDSKAKTGFSLDESQDGKDEIDGCPIKKAGMNPTDWVVINSNAYQIKSKGTSNLTVNTGLSQNLSAGTDVHILGFSYGKQAQQGTKLNPLYSKSTVAQTGLTNGIINVTNRNFGPGNAGGPVFAYDKDNKRYSIVGIVSAGIGSEIGIIIPISRIH